jgi:hypothetical protein
MMGMVLELELGIIVYLPQQVMVVPHVLQKEILLKIMILIQKTVIHMIVLWIVMVHGGTGRPVLNHVLMRMVQGYKKGNIVFFKIR